VSLKFFFRTFLNPQFEEKINSYTESVISVLVLTLTLKIGSFLGFCGIFASYLDVLVKIVKTFSGD